MNIVDELIRQVKDIQRQLEAIQRLDRQPPTSSIVTYSGTPVAGQVAQFTGGGTVTNSGYAGTAVTRYSGVPTAGAVTYWTGNGTVTYGSIDYSNSGTPTLAATTSVGMNFKDDGGNLGIRIADNGNVGMSPAGTAPFSNIATLATYPGRGLHIKPQAGQRAVLILDSDSLADIVMVHTGAGSNVKSLVYRNISGVYTILVQTDDGSSSTDLQVINMTTGFAGFGMAATTRLGMKVGTSTNDAAVGGVLYVTSTQGANVGAGEDDLASYAVPANTLSTNNMSLWFEAWGSFAANGNNKQIRARFGTTGTNLMFDSTAVAINGQDWYVRGRIIRTGAATQKSVVLFGRAAISVDSVTGLDQTLSGAVTLKITGEATSNSDVVLEGMIVGFDEANT